MNVKIQSVKFDADKKLEAFIQEKVNKLDRFVEDAISAEVTLRIDKDNERGNKVVMLKIAVPGNDLVAERKSKSFEESVDLCIDAIKKQVEKRKTKITKHV